VNRRQRLGFPNAEADAVHMHCDRHSPVNMKTVAVKRNSLVQRVIIIIRQRAAGMGKSMQISG